MNCIIDKYYTDSNNMKQTMDHNTSNLSIKYERFNAGFRLGTFQREVSNVLGLWCGNVAESREAHSFPASSVPPEERFCVFCGKEIPSQVDKV